MPKKSLNVNEKIMQEAITSLYAGIGDDTCRKGKPSLLDSIRLIITACQLRSINWPGYQCPKRDFSSFILMTKRHQ